MNRQLPKVLFVCHGNINRSAASGALFRWLNYPADRVRSRGLRETKGERATLKMREELAKRSERINLEDHRSQQVTAEDLRWADVVVYYDGGNLKRLLALLDELELENPPDLVSLGQFDVKPVTRIADPNYIKRGSEELTEVVSQICRCTAYFFVKLTRGIQ